MALVGLCLLWGLRKVDQPINIYLPYLTFLHKHYVVLIMDIHSNCIEGFQQEDIQE